MVSIIGVVSSKEPGWYQWVCRNVSFTEVDTEIEVIKIIHCDSCGKRGVCVFRNNVPQFPWKLVAVGIILILCKDWRRVEKSQDPNNIGDSMTKERKIVHTVGLVGRDIVCLLYTSPS